jgi:uncharacterized integral membrane protein
MSGHWTDAAMKEHSTGDRYQTNNKAILVSLIVIFLLILLYIFFVIPSAPRSHLRHEVSPYVDS